MFEKQLLTAALCLCLLAGISVSVRGLETEKTEAAVENAETTEESPADSVIMETGLCGKDGDNLTYTLYWDGTLVVKGTGEMQDFQAPGGSGLIPDAPWKTDCVKAVIEDGVTSVGENAFMSCLKLERVELAGSVQRIGKSAFAGSSCLKSVTLREGTCEIGPYAFSQCDHLEEADIPGACAIGGSAFIACSSLKRVNLGEGLVSIGQVAFYGCSGLEEIEIPKSVETIGVYPFLDSGLARAWIQPGWEYEEGVFPDGCEVLLREGPDPLEKCVTVFAACYESGALAEIVQGGMEGGKPLFSREIPAGWVMYFLDENGVPVCPAEEVIEP